MNLPLEQLVLNGRTTFSSQLAAHISRCVPALVLSESCLLAHNFRFRHELVQIKVESSRVESDSAHVTGLLMAVAGHVIDGS